MHKGAMAVLRYTSYTSYTMKQSAATLSRILYNGPSNILRICLTMRFIVILTQ